MAETIESALESGDAGFAARIRSAVIWRSGSQIAAQLIAWSATVFVIRLLRPADYGLMAMTAGVLALASLLNGYSFAGALVQREELDRTRAAQVFGMLILMNFGLAAAQVLLAPVAAAYFHQPLVAPMLRVQALLHVTTPFIIMPNALLARRIDFRVQARVNLIAGPVAAATAIGGALGGWGVWALVAAPLALFGTRAVGLLVVGRWWIAPSFRFAGASSVFGFGGAMLACDLFWFAQGQADVFIAGRRLSAHDLGLYSTALFLAQILTSKFVPALNEVAFPSYARLNGGGAALGPAFKRATRAIFIVVLPWCVGLACVAEPLVGVALGAKWAGAVPVVRLLALAMPFSTLHILYGPATNAIGRPAIGARIGAAGTAIMAAAFMIGVRFGPVGLAWAWLAGYPLLALVASALSLPAIGLRLRDLAGVLMPALGPALAMAAVVLAVDRVAAFPGETVRLAVLVGVGAIVYAGGLLTLSRRAVDDAVALVRARRAP